MCHRGRTIYVEEQAVPAHLAHGDSLGACSMDVVICMSHGDGEHPDRHTKVVPQSELAAYQQRGAVLGPCPNSVFMCNNQGHSVVVDASRVQDHLARGQTLGLCPGLALVCYRNHTIRTDIENANRLVAKGGHLGYCYGGPGPLISSNNVPPSMFP